MSKRTYELRFLDTNYATVPVILMQDPSVEHIFIQASTDYGRANEVTVESAHAIEHFTLAGTKKFPSKKGLADAAADLGGMVNAGTMDSGTMFFAMLPSKDHLVGVDLITDLVLSPLFPENEIIPVKKSIEVELGMRERADPYKVFALFSQAYFPEGGYGYRESLDQRLVSLAGLSVEQLRNDFAQFYTPEHLSFLAGGNFDADEICSLISKAIEDKFEPRAVANPSRLKEHAGSQYKHLSIAGPLKTEFMVLGMKAPDAEDEGFYPMKILNYTLGGKPSARISFRMREEEHLSYGTFTQFVCLAGKGRFSVQTDTRAGNMGKAEEVIIEELAKAREKGLTEDEVAKAKEALAGKIHTIDGTQARVDYLHKRYLERKALVTPEEEVERIQVVTPEDVLRVAREVIPAEFTPENYASARLIAE